MVITIAIVIGLSFVRDSCEIQFDRPSGFYEDPFSLNIVGKPIFDIYYTLDGSIPTRESMMYSPKNGIAISDASDRDNVFSARTDISAVFSEYIGLSNRSDGNKYAFAVPDQKLDKGTVVRAAVISKSGEVISSIQGIYFVGFQDKAAYEDIFVVSICADPDALFDYETGILVTGKTLDDYFRSSLNEDGEFAPTEWNPYYWWWPANYRNEGKEWEREAQITVFDPQREIVLDQQCGIRIHGGGSRGYPSRSIRCIARGEYSGSSTFPVDWFGADIEPQKFVLYSGGDDYIFKLRDYLGQTLAEPLNFATQDFEPCCLFLNGEYWGFYFLSENYNSNYISDHYGVSDSNIVMMKSGELTEGDEKDRQLFLDMKTFVVENDMSIMENYQKACELIDMSSFIDYYAFQIYIGRYKDWPSSNYAAWRTRNPDSGIYGDCKWRWMLFDLNSQSMDVLKKKEDTLGYVLGKDLMFASLWQSPEFRGRFSDRIDYIGNTIFTDDAWGTLIEYYDLAFRSQLMENSKRFFPSEKDAEFNRYLEDIRYFFSGRTHVVQQFVADHMEE